MRLTTAVIALMLAAAPVAAADFTHAWVTHLARDGYHEITVRRTWLGRIRIVAEKDDVRREVVINPATGEVLRDYSRGGDGRIRLPIGFNDDNDDDKDNDRDDEEEEDDDDGDDDDEEDDEEDEEDDEKDNSGSGSSNSGSGSSNSGSGSNNSGSGKNDD